MKIKKLMAVLLILIILASSMIGTTGVSASEINYSIYRPDFAGYYYYTIPLVYKTTKTITYIDGLDIQMSSPNDIFVNDEEINEAGDKETFLYVVDSNNGRVLKLTQDGIVVREYAGEYGEEDKTVIDNKLAEIAAYYDKLTEELDSQYVSRINDLQAQVDAASSAGNKKEQDKLEEQLNALRDEYNEKKSPIDVNRKHAERVTNAKQKKKMNAPQGVYVDDDLSLYIADRDNNRVLHLSQSGNFIEAFYEPAEKTFDSLNYHFRPSKLYLDKVGRLYVLNYNDYHGFITLNANSSSESNCTFLGYVAQSDIDYDLWMNILSMIYSEDVMQREFTRTTPPYFSNFVISKFDEESLIYAVAQNDVKNHIKKLTPSGNNIYPEGIYGAMDTTMKAGDVDRYASFVDITVGRTGLIYAADSRENAMTMYGTAGIMEVDIFDTEGNSVAVVGEYGNYKGAFTQISSIDIDGQDRLYVLDRSKNTIQIMEPTNFMNKILEASEQYNQGFYDRALEPWKEVLSMHNTYSLAVKGIAKAEYGNDNYEEAMRLYKLALDKPGYSESFYDYRMQTFRNNFEIVVLVIVALIFGLVFLLSFLKKKSEVVDLIDDYSNDKFGFRIFFHTLLLVVFHPIDAFNKLKANRDRYRIWMIIALFLAIVINIVLYIYLVHFPLGNDLPQHTDFVREIMTFVIPIAAWIIIGFAITSISNGKTKFKESCISALFSFTPYILLTIPLALLSNIMATTEQGTYTALRGIVMLWCISLLLLSLMNLNEYSFKQMVGNTFKILFAIVCVFMIMGMVYVIINQFVVFIDEVNVELLYISNNG